MLNAVGPPALESCERAEIDVGAASLEALFNAFDKSPLERRTLHPDFQTLLQRRALALKKAKSLRIIVHLPPGCRQVALEEGVARAIKENLRHTGNFLARSTKIAVLKAVILFCLGTALLAPAYFLWASYSDPRFATLFGEAIYIGGWVMVWECVYLLVFTIPDEIWAELRLDRKLEKAEIVFQDDDHGLTAAVQSAPASVEVQMRNLISA